MLFLLRRALPAPPPVADGKQDWKYEYDWDRSRISYVPDLALTTRETILAVVFDSDAQRRFSSVQITLFLNNSVPAKVHKEWKITSLQSSFSVVNRTSVHDTPTTQNDPFLPICHIAFMADRCSARSHTRERTVQRGGELVLIDPRSAKRSSPKIFEFNLPLTESTQSVSVSFTSSCLFSTMVTHDPVFSYSQLDQPATVGRIVRVIPTEKRGSISLPTDVLYLIFEHMYSPLTNRNWRQDLLSAALVCREWTCALDALLIDFRRKGDQRWIGHPPEVTSLANALVAHPDLGLNIRYLSAGYLERHPDWCLFPELSSTKQGKHVLKLLKLRLEQHEWRRSQFSKSFLSILRVAENVETLSLDSDESFVVSREDLAEALSGHHTLGAFGCKCTLPMAQLLSCIAPCASLKRLTIRGVPPPSIQAAPLASPAFHLTSLTITNVSIKDEELACLANASSSTLQQLTLVCDSPLTNAGLGGALTAVSASLTYLHLYVNRSGLARSPGEEHALDATIACMERLTDLEIVPALASQRMMERRAEAFVRRISPCAVPLLPEVRLYLILGQKEQPEQGMLDIVARDWPGWKIDDRSAQNL